MNAPTPAITTAGDVRFGIALDEVANVLYVADNDNDRVRAVDLNNGTISTVAGGGSAVGPGYGDGGLAAFPPSGGAFISGPTHVSVGPNGLLYVTAFGNDCSQLQSSSRRIAGSRRLVAEVEKRLR